MKWSIRGCQIAPVYLCADPPIPEDELRCKWRWKRRCSWGGTIKECKRDRNGNLRCKIRTFSDICWDVRERVCSV